MNSIQTLDKIMEDLSLRQQIFATSDEGELLRILNSNGLNLKQEELHDFLKTLSEHYQVPQSEDIDEESLEDVSGGGFATLAWMTAPVMPFSFAAAATVGVGVGLTCLAIWAYKKYRKKG